MKRILAHPSMVVLALAALLLAAGTIWADSPHFTKGTVTSTDVVDTAGDCTGDVDVSFKETGLGDTVSIDYKATASATATYVCVNNGGQCPNAENKQSVQGPVASPTTTFNSDKNGNIVGTVTLSPPTATPFCPSGQTETLASVSYSGIKITDITNNKSQTASPSSASCTVFTCP